MDMPGAEVIRKCLDMLSGGREMENCGNCRNGRKAGGDGIWCRLFGIMINCRHEGCKSHKGGEPDEAEGSAAEAGVDGR